MDSRRRHLFERLRRRGAEPRPAPVAYTPPSPWRSVDPALDHELQRHLHPELLFQGPCNALRPVGPDLFVLPVLDANGLARLLALLEHRLDWQRVHGHSSPNSMHYSGVPLEELGLTAAGAALRALVVAPIAAQCFPELGPLDHEYGFCATYGQGLDRHLGFHADDSEVTLNLCLGREFHGGELVFQGRRCQEHRQSPHRPEEEQVVRLQPGEALVHTGAHRHFLRSVDGERRNLILWCRSSALRATLHTAPGCPEWCGHQPEGAPLS